MANSLSEWFTTYSEPFLLPKSSSSVKGHTLSCLLSNFPFKERTFNNVCSQVWTNNSFGFFPLFFRRFLPNANAIPGVRVHRPDNTMYISSPPFFKIVGSFYLRNAAEMHHLAEKKCLWPTKTPQGLQIVSCNSGYIYVDYRPVLKPETPFSVTAGAALAAKYVPYPPNMICKCIFSC